MLADALFVVEEGVEGGTGEEVGEDLGCIFRAAHAGEVFVDYGDAGEHGG